MSRAEQFAPLEPEVFERWSRFGRTAETPLFVNLLGLAVDDDHLMTGIDQLAADPVDTGQTCLRDLPHGAGRVESERRGQR